MTASRLKKNKKPQRQIIEKVLTCVVRKFLGYYSPDLTMLVNIPGYSPSAVCTSDSVYDPERWTDPGRRIFFLPPPLLLQDRCERSWQSLSTCIPAMDAHEGPTIRFRPPFKGKSRRRLAGARLLFWSLFPRGRPWVFARTLPHHLHPLQSQSQR